MPAPSTCGPYRFVGVSSRANTTRGAMGIARKRGKAGAGDPSGIASHAGDEIIVCLELVGDAGRAANWRPSADPGRKGRPPAGWPAGAGIGRASRGKATRPTPTTLADTVHPWLSCLRAVSPYERMYTIWEVAVNDGQRCVPLGKTVSNAELRPNPQRRMPHIQGIQNVSFGIVLHQL